MSSIKLTQISKRHGANTILNDVNITIADGEFLTLLGPSGCGKSTLLRIVAGLDDNYDGTIAINGNVVDDLRPKERDISMVFQSYALYPHMSVRENISLPLNVRRLSSWQRLPFARLVNRSARRTRAEIAREVEHVAEVLEIEKLLERKPGQLSGGQRQRVALARAIIRQPRAFLMDEPLSNLDAKLRVQMRTEITDLHRRLKATFVYVTHDQSEAMTMSDRIAVMVGGEILQIGSPQDIYDDPASTAVARFVGSPRINLLAANTESDGVVRLAGTQLPLRVSGSHREGVIIGLRPEAFTISLQGQPASFAGRVRMIENFGSDLFVHLDVPGQTESVIVRQGAGSKGLRTDSIVHVSFDASRAVVFDADGDKRLVVANSSPMPTLARA